MKRVFGALVCCPSVCAFAAVALLLSFCLPVDADESTYRTLSTATLDHCRKIHAHGNTLDWSTAGQERFIGNLRLMQTPGDVDPLFLVRRPDGRLHLVSIPPGQQTTPSGTPSLTRTLKRKLGNKLMFDASLAEVTIDGRPYSFIRLLRTPEQLLPDRIFKIAAMFMFFFVMVGIGLTLTIADFRVILIKPRAIAVGMLMQWLLMPFLALVLARLFGFYDRFPFIFAGLVLICACPGGVTSNLMTYYAKGDLALSVSLTSLSTILALFFTPLLLSLFCANIPNVHIPTVLILKTIFGLVLLPMIAGMLIRTKFPGFARKSTPFFSALGMFALVFVIGFGVVTNLEKFADTGRYGVVFYASIVLLSLTGMIMGAALPKLFNVSNSQARAISVEVGLRNSTLAVTIALLIQDLMGDYYSSMFATTAIYGLSMYLIGFLMIPLYTYLLPVTRDGALGLSGPVEAV